MQDEADTVEDAVVERYHLQIKMRKIDSGSQISLGINLPGIWANKPRRVAGIRVAVIGSWRPLVHVRKLIIVRGLQTGVQTGDQ